MRERLRRLRGDEGIGLTELSVAIVVLVGLFPLMANSVALAQRSADASAAARILSTQLDRARVDVAAAGCSAGSSNLALPSATDEARFQAQRVVACDGRLATVTVNVQLRSAPTATISTATTKVVAQ